MQRAISEKYPSETECLKLAERFGMFPNIIRHSIQVKNVSVAIYNALIDKSTISKELLISSALLHDIAKTSSIKSNDLRHDLTGGRMLRELGYDDIAEIVENHVVFTGFIPHGPVNEKEIIYYADKRVMHDRIVSIDTRIEDLVERYGKTERVRELILKNKKFVQELEEKIRLHMKIPLDKALEDL